MTGRQTQDVIFQTGTGPFVSAPARGTSLLLAFFLATGLLLILLSVAQVVKHHEIGAGVAIFAAGILALAAAGIVWSGPQALATSSRTVQFGLAVIALLWCIWGGVIAYAHRVEQWDESAYVLSGMALRGYNVPFAAHRPPVISFLCAFFVGWDRFLNPILIGVILVITYLWTRRLLGPIYAGLALLVILCQNVFLESTVDIMSELPAALLLLLGFYSLARDRVWSSAFCFGLLVFARWNLAPVWALVVTAVLLRFGLGQAMKFVAAATILFAAWYGVARAMGTSNPLLAVYHGNFLPGLAWAETPDQKPDFLLRLDFYAKHFFFLTPPILFALIANPLQNLRKQLPNQLWVVLIVLPIALAGYLLSMLAIGALFPRFVTPLIPCAAITLLVGLSRFCDDFSCSDLSRFRVVVVTVFLVCAVGLWPMSALARVHANRLSPPVFSKQLQKKLLELDRNARLNALPEPPVSAANGYPAMVEIRHTILFPTAHRDSNTSIVAEPDSADSVGELEATCHPGDLLLIPEKDTSGIEPTAVLFSDGVWTVVRNPGAKP